VLLALLALNVIQTVLLQLKIIPCDSAYAWHTSSILCNQRTLGQNTAWQDNYSLNARLRIKSVQQLTMKGSLLPLFSDKPTRTKGTAINSHWIHCELQTFKRNKNKHVLRTNWLLNPQLRSLVFSVIRNTLTQLAEFGLHTKSAEMLLTRN